jgi:hypothetical protein
MTTWKDSSSKFPRCSHLLVTLVFPFQNDGEHEAFRLDLQQQVVRGHLHHPLPQQEGKKTADL